MDLDYIVVAVVLIVLGAVFVFYSQWKFKKNSVAIEIAGLITTDILLVAIAAFFLGREGINAKRLTITVFALVPPLSILFVRMMNRTVRPLQLLLKRSNELAEGKLGEELENNARNEYRDLIESFNRILRRYGEIEEASRELASGNLLVTFQPQSDEDALGKAILNLRDEWSNLLRGMKRQADSAADRATETALVAGQLLDAAISISEAMQQMSSAIGTQTENALRTANSMDLTKRAIEGVAQGAQEQANAVCRSAAITSEITSSMQSVRAISDGNVRGTEQTVSAVQEGVSVVEKTRQGMASILAEVQESADKVLRMGDYSESIGLIVETIDDIASQTNLLALNAAIEAARAGEHGKGFAVVADEVRKLAERTAAATKEIGDLIGSVQSTVSEAVDSMRRSMDVVATGVDQSTQAKEVLERIEAASHLSQEGMGSIQAAMAQMLDLASELVEAMDTVSAIVEENTAASEEMSANSEEVATAVDNIASISEENAAATQEVSASIEELTAQVQEVNQTARVMEEMGGALSEMMSGFNVNHGEELVGDVLIGGNGHQREKTTLADRL